MYNRSLTLTKDLIWAAGQKQKRILVWMWTNWLCTPCVFSRDQILLDPTLYCISNVLPLSGFDWVTPGVMICLWQPLREENKLPWKRLKSHKASVFSFIINWKTGAKEQRKPGWDIYITGTKGVLFCFFNRSDGSRSDLLTLRERAMRPWNGKYCCVLLNCTHIYNWRER